MNKQNKLLIVICGIVFLLISGCGKTSVTEINYNKFTNLVDSKRSFIIYIGSSTCHNCTSFNPKFEKVVNDYKISNVYYIDLNNLTKKEKNNFNKIINVTGTPTVAFITRGVEESSFNRITGNVDEEKIINRLKSNDYIK